MAGFALLLTASAGGGEDDARQAVRMLDRLERTCAQYAGKDSHKLLDAMILEAVRLYEGARYDPALDSILFAWAMYPSDVAHTYYGVQPAMVEIALRWPSPGEKGLLPLDDARYTWVMAAVANVSGVRLELGGLRAVVEYEGMSVKDINGNKVESLGPLVPDLRSTLGDKASLLEPPAVNHGETVTFPIVFPAFERWTEIRLVHEPNRISVPVRNYASMGANLARWLRARKLVSELPSRKEPEVEGAAGEAAKPPAPSPYVLIGYVRNEIVPGKYGVQVLARDLAKQHERFYIREGGAVVAELRSIGSGTIAELVGGPRQPCAGDAVYILTKDK